MRANTFQTNLTAGELSERLNGRVDLSRYANGVATMENFIATPQGGAIRRPGTQFVAESQHSGDGVVVRLVPFEFNDEQAYVLAFSSTPGLGNTTTIQFFMNGGIIESAPGFPVSISAEYSVDELADLKFVQSADVMYICHPNRPVRKLTRTSHIAWTIDDVVFEAGPFRPSDASRAVLQATLDAAYMVSDTTAPPGDGWGDAVSADASGVGGSSDHLYVGSEDPSGGTDDRHHRIILKFSFALAIQEVVRATLKITQISRADTGTYPAVLDHATGAADGSSASEYELTGKSQIGTVLDRQQNKTHEIDVTDALREQLSNGDTHIKFRLRPAAINTIGLADNTSRVFAIGSSTIAAASRPQLEIEYLQNIAITPSATTGAITLTASSALFSADQVGALWSLTQAGRTGYVEITGFTSTTVVNATVKKNLGGTRPTGIWAEGAWSEKRGYPRAVSFFEDRLVFAGPDPQTIYGSKSGDYENFEAGAEDDNAVIFTINSNKVNVIRWLVEGRQLIIGTTGSIFKMDGGGDNVPMTPSSVTVKNACKYAASRTQPAEVGEVVLFPQRSGKKLRELVFSFDADTYIAADMSILSEHIAQQGIKEIAWQEERDPVLWCVLDNGQLAGMTYERQHEVVGWHRQITGFVESVATIPHPLGDRNQTWLVVRRAVNGATVRYIEYLNDNAGFYGQLMVDSGLTYSGAPVSTVTGLDHLEGRIVQVVGDGCVYPEATVVGGSVTLDGPAASVIEVGLPFTSTIRTLRPEVAGEGGTIQFTKQRFAKVIVRFLGTVGVRINGERISMRKAGQPMDEPTPLFSGDWKKTNLGFEEGAPITIVQDQPLPITVLGIAGILDANTV